MFSDIIDVFCFQELPGLLTNVNDYINKVLTILLSVVMFILAIAITTVIENAIVSVTLIYSFIHFLTSKINPDKRESNSESVDLEFFCLFRSKTLQILKAPYYSSFVRQVHRWVRRWIPFTKGPVMQRLFLRHAVNMAGQCPPTQLHQHIRLHAYCGPFY